MAEAGELRGMTERTFRRGSGRYHAEGAEGLQDRRIGRASARAVPVDAARRMVTRADATTEIYLAFFVEAAGTRSRVRGLREGMEPPGRVRSLSPDRGAHDGPTEEAGGPAPCRTDGPQRWRGTGFRSWRRPTGLCPSTFSRSIIPGFWWGPRNRAPPSSPGSARTSPRFCVCLRSGSWPRRIRCGSRGRPCRSRRIPPRFHEVTVTVRVHE